MRSPISVLLEQETVLKQVCRNGDWILLQVLGFCFGFCNLKATQFVTNCILLASYVFSCKTEIAFQAFKNDYP